MPGVALTRLVTSLPRKCQLVVSSRERSGVDLAAYRIIQEALTNSLKHGASRARVELLRERTALVIDVVDRGTSPAARDRAGTPLSGGQGLIGMQERVHFFGGDLVAGPCDGGGSQ